MQDEELGRRAAGVGMLADPVRRELYRYVVGQPGPVSREQASTGCGLPHHTAKFHLDRLVEAGLLITEYRRPPGRTGPGAGRPTKLYRRSDAEVTVSLPQRRYELAGSLMAQAIDDSVATGRPVLEALHGAAGELGGALGRQVRAALGGPGAGGPAVGDPVVDDVGVDDPVVDGPASDDAVDEGPSSVVVATCAALTDLGYEPQLTGREIALTSCPFHALVADHGALVCGMNLALLGALVDTVASTRSTGGDRLEARLEPAEGRCCVVLSTGSPDVHRRGSEAG